VPQNVVRREAGHLYAARPSAVEAADAVDALLQVQNAGDKELERIRIASGLSNAEFHAVRYLLQAERDERLMGPKDLVVMLGVSNASVTNVIDHLEALGDVERTAHPSDRRAQYVRPTAAAAKKIDNAYRHFHETIAAVMADIPASDARVVAQVLNQITDQLNERSGS
jgi:DNA-binding MarR family transcriptional regulator